METNIEIEKLGAYAKTLQRTADHLLDNLERQMLQDAEDMAGRQRSNCPEDTGLLRESIAAFCERDGDRVTAGSRTNMQYAAYVEFGTGPVGDERVHRWTVSWVLCASMSLGLRIYPATDFAG